MSENFDVNTKNMIEFIKKNCSDNKIVKLYDFLEELTKKYKFESITFDHFKESLIGYPFLKNKPKHIFIYDENLDEEKQITLNYFKVCCAQESIQLDFMKETDSPVSSDLIVFHSLYAFPLLKEKIEKFLKKNQYLLFFDTTEFYKYSEFIANHSNIKEIHKKYSGKYSELDLKKGVLQLILSLVDKKICSLQIRNDNLGIILLKKL